MGMMEIEDLQQLTIFDELDKLKENVIIVQRFGVIKNQVSILYKGHHVANARDCENGFYEVRPKSLYFNSRDQMIRLMKKPEIEEFCKLSFVDKYYI